MGLVGFCFVWGGGEGVGDGRRLPDCAPVVRYSGDSGAPGAGTLQARYPMCSTAARTRPGRAVRHGSYTWVGCTALKQPKGAGSSCRPHRSSNSNIAEASGSREQRRKRLRAGGAPRTPRLGPAPPRERSESTPPASLGGVGSFQTSSLTREETCSRPPVKRWWSLQFYVSNASSIARVGEGLAGAYG